jgi:hypothetical protein
MAIKTTAVSLLGFVLGLTASFDRKLSRHQRLALWLGAAFVVCFAFQMTLAEKKFARYALPALQFVALVAGVGWTWILGRTTRRRPYLAFLGALCLIALQFAVSIPRHPYYGTHYNYMLGGPKFVLEHGIVDGQEKGEGLEIAAAYLNDLPLSKLLVVGAQSFGGFYFYFDGKAVPLTDDHVDYLLFARSQVLRQVYAEEWWSTWEAYRQRAPKLVVAFDGVPYVWVYKTGPIIDEAYIGHPTEARIGPAFRLLGYDFEPDQARPGETTHLSLYWECAQQQPGDYTVFVHLIDVNGEMRGQQDNPPQHGMYPTYLWDTSERIEDRYALVVEPTTSPGQAQFAVGMYSLATMERLPITNAAGEALADRQILLEGPSIRP